MRHVRNAEGLAAIVRQFFRVPAAIEEFVGHWLRLAPAERSYLRRDGASLGSGAVLGSRVWDHQSKFRIHLGPLTFARYQEFLPGGAVLRQLVAWVRLYLDFEHEWDVRLSLVGRETS